DLPAYRPADAVRRLGHVAVEPAQLPPTGEPPLHRHLPAPPGGPVGGVPPRMVPRLRARGGGDEGSPAQVGKQRELDRSAGGLPGPQEDQSMRVGDDRHGVLTASDRAGHAWQQRALSGGAAATPRPLVMNLRLITRVTTDSGAAASR